MIILENPLYVLSKKHYASGETTIEFIIRNNVKMSSTMFLTTKNEELQKEFNLGEEYTITFEKVEKGD